MTQIDPARVVAEFSVTGKPARLPALPRYNVAPTQRVAVVRILAVSEGRRVDALVWGLVPSWARDARDGARMINARVETLATKPAFREAARARRCLVVAEGFYEWERRGRERQPYYVRRLDGGLLAMAGLWEVWTSPDGEVLETCAIVTKPAAAPLARIHDRMPAILGEVDHAAWLDPDRKAPPTALILAPSPELELAPVSTLVNKPANDGPGCIERVAITPGLFDPR